MNATALSFIQANRLAGTNPGSMASSIALHAVASAVDAQAAARGPAAGRPVRFRGVAYSGGTLRVAGFRDGVVIDLAGLRVPTQVSLQANHSVTLDAKLGQATARIEAGRLVIEGSIIPGSPLADRAIDLLRAGSLPLSVGVLVHETDSPQSPATVNGSEVQAPIVIARSAELVEVSATGVGADPGAFAIAASAAAGNQDPSNPSGSPMHASPATSAGNTDMQAERRRVSGILAAFQGIAGDPAAGQARALELIQAGATVDQARQAALELHRASLPQIGPGYMSSQSRHLMAAGGGDVTEIGIAAVMIHAGLADVAERTCQAQAVENGATLARRAGSLVGISREILNASGRPAPDDVDHMIRASFSTDALAGILSGSIQRIALDAFVRADESWRMTAKRVPLRDFRENTIARLAGKFNFEKVGADGELKHAVVDGETSTIKLGTAGKIVQITRQTLVNDDVGLLADIPTELGLEGARSIGDDLATLIADAGGTFFTVGRGNLLSGGSSALSIDALSSAVVALRSMTDTSGRKLNLAPYALVVSPELETTARAILTSTELENFQASAADAKLPTGNPMRSIAKLQVDARLGATEWYLTATPRNGAIVVGTLGGADAPIVEPVSVDANVLGIAWRGYFDFGVALHEWRAIVKSLGQ